LIEKEATWGDSDKMEISLINPNPDESWEYQIDLCNEDKRITKPEQIERLMHQTYTFTNGDRCIQGTIGPIDGEIMF
jgi:hypothetical protein